MKRSFRVYLYIMVIGLIFFNSSKTYAYLDPGAGSQIFQITIAFLVGGAFIIKLHWRKFLFFLRKIKNGK